MNELDKLRQLTEVLTANGYLKDQTEAWEYAFNSVETSVIITNTSYKIKFVNDAFNSLVEVDRYHLINKRISSILSGELFSIDDEKIKVGQDSYFEFDIEFIKSLDIWVRKKKYSINDDIGTLVGYLFIMEDVTERERALLKVQESHEEIKSIVKKMQRLLSISDSYSWEKTVDPSTGELVFVYTDPAFCNDLFGIRLEASDSTYAPIFGKTFDELTTNFESGKRMHVFGDISKITDKHSIEQAVTCEYIEMGYIEKEDGVVDWVIIAVKKTPSFDNNGRCTGIIGTTNKYSYLFNDIIAFIKKGISNSSIEKIDTGTEESKIYWIKDPLNEIELNKNPLTHVDFP